MDSVFGRNAGGIRRQNQRNSCRGERFHAAAGEWQGGIEGRLPDSLQQPGEVRRIQNGIRGRDGEDKITPAGTMAGRDGKAVRHIGSIHELKPIVHRFISFQGQRKGKRPGTGFRERNRFIRHTSGLIQRGKAEMKRAGAVGSDKAGTGDFPPASFGSGQLNPGALYRSQNEEVADPGRPERLKVQFKGIVSVRCQQIGQFHLFLAGHRLLSAAFRE